MPRERKQRGRRKKKEEPEEEINAVTSATTINAIDDDADKPYNFYGLLDESEQTYYKMIDDAFIADEFATREDQQLFVTNVFHDAEGKELKLATSPLGSRVLEQLLAKSTHEQVRALFKKFNGEFITLVKHRYASHVCEMLFAITSTLVAYELTHPRTSVVQEEGEEAYVSSEILFLHMLHELTPEMPSLLDDHYASHVVRDLFLILIGRLFVQKEAQAQKKRYHAQKKFSWARPSELMGCPSSFKGECQKLLSQLGMISQQELRMLASKPYSVSTMETMITIQAEQSDKRTFRDAIFGGEHITQRDDFVESIMRESSGSKLIETAAHCLDGSGQDAFYNIYLKGRLARLASGPVTNFIVQGYIADCNNPTIIAALIEELGPVFKDLRAVNHTQTIQRLIEASSRIDCHQALITEAVHTAFAVDDLKLLDLVREVEENHTTNNEGYSMQGAFLLQSIFQLSSHESDTLIKEVLELSTPTLIEFTQHPAPLRVLELIMTSAQTTPVHRKQILNKFTSHFIELACHATSSHFVDLCWRITSDLKLYKDRIAQELLNGADEVRSNYYGRLVWRNWQMDLFKNKRGEWNGIIKGEAAKANGMARLERQSAVPADDSMHPSRQVKEKRRVTHTDTIDVVFRETKRSRTNIT